jgi:tRNA(Ile)-lysidine synthase
MDLLPTVTATIDRYDLLPADANVLVAVSGGADSLTLLDVLRRLAPERGWHLRVATFDHAWRADSADDAAWVTAYALALDLECHAARASEPAADEAGARDQRRAFLDFTADALRPDTRIALGHSADDRVETLLLNLLRGCGLTGLSAMPPRAGRIVRPLIECRRQDIRAYAAERGLPVREDPSNLDARFERNRLRLEVLPRLEALRPGALAALARTALVCHEEHEALDRYAALLLDRLLVTPSPRSLIDDLDVLVMEVGEWLEMPPAERHLVLRALLARWRGHLADVDFQAIATLDHLCAFRHDAGGLRLPKSFGEAVASRWGDRLIFGAVPIYSTWGPRAVNFDGPTELPEVGLKLLVGDAARGCALQARLRPEPDMVLRPRRPGDTIRIDGRGRRKVSDLLLEYGLPAVIRQRVPLMVWDDKVVWVPGGPAAGEFVDEHGLRVGIAARSPLGT